MLFLEVDAAQRETPSVSKRPACVTSLIECFWSMPDMKCYQLNLDRRSERQCLPKILNRAGFLN